ncbi:MAG TPA: amylo-alpha-1,6-glucosidase [Burkholderiales bacterium]|jgi:glycogen debranching enzyme|nr:amylo-alpha-1,6-glucosidase [Burkholderiales bacterium]
MDETIKVDDRWYVLATSSRADDRTRVLKHGDTFALFDRFGDIERIGSGEQGLYHEGTRYLSRLDLRLNGERPLLLNSSVRQDNCLLTVDLMAPDFYEDGKLTVLKGTVHLSRSKLLAAAGSHERLRLMNYSSQAVRLTLSLQFGADYADIFEVRGMKRERRGEDLTPQLQEGRVILGYKGLDGVTRHTTITCTPTPHLLAPDHLEYELQLPPQGHIELHIAVQCGLLEPAQKAPAYVQVLAGVEAELRDARAQACSIHTSSEQVNDWLGRSSADLDMLGTATAEGSYPYAGVPWFSTPFGRDGIITALQTLWVDPSMARGVLGFLARHQASEVKPEQDAEPGKILHEMRQGELAALGEIPFGLYYGSIDSTPLFVILAGAYFQRSGDLAFLQKIWPNVVRALEWIDKYGDPDGDGFLEYARKNSSGLVNQGWKDSEDAVFHRDGKPAAGPVALSEVQGYVYLAKTLAADAAHALGDSQRAIVLLQQAARLRERFEAAYWSEELSTYAIALDGAKRPCLVRSSNAGQVLWSGIAGSERAARTAQTLLAPASFSGWGVRTIAEGEARYNPMSYHNGSIWPHDNSLIAMGLARYGMKEEAQAIFTAMFEASLFMDLHRLPELYCGFALRPREGPTLYPVACSPQAWASASAFYLLQACLGLSFDATSRRIRFDHPVLPGFLDRIEIRGLKLGDASVDLVLERHESDVGVIVTRKQGEVEVSVNL